MNTTGYANALLVIVVLALMLIPSCSDDSPTEPRKITVEIHYSPVNPSSGTLVSFEAVTTAELPDEAWYQWDFGDDTPVKKNYFGNTYQHHYADPGIYTVSVKVYSSPDGNLLGEATTKVHVGSFQSSFALTVSSTSVAIGEEVQFTVHNLGTLIPEARYRWDFGDGSTVVDVVGDSTSTHTYQQAGVYTAACTVYDNGSGEMRWVGDIKISVADVPRPLFANYIKLSLHGEFVYRRVYSKLGELQMDSIIVIDTISTRILDVVSGQGEALKWEGQHLKGRFSAKTSRIKKYIDVDIELSDDGNRIVALHVDGNIQVEDYYDQYRADTLSLAANSIPISGQLTPSSATYTLDIARTGGTVTTLVSTTHNRKDGLFDDKYTYLELVPGSEGYLEVELYKAW